MVRRAILLLAITSVSIALYACGSATPEANPPSDDSCPTVNPGPPPVCPEGCVWNGSECRKHSSIIMPDVTRPDSGSSSR